MGRKECESLSGVKMRLYVKFEGDVCRNVNMMAEHTDGQTDELFLISIDSHWILEYVLSNKEQQ